MGHRGLCGRDSLWAEPWRMVVLRKGGQGSLQIEGSPGRDTQCLYPVINFVAMWAHKCYVFCHLQLIFLCLKKSPEPKYKTFNWHFQFFEVLCTRAAGIIVHIVSYPRGALLGPGRDWGGELISSCILFTKPCIQCGLHLPREERKVKVLVAQLYPTLWDPMEV